MHVMFLFYKQSISSNNMNKYIYKENIKQERTIQQVTFYTVPVKPLKLKKQKIIISTLSWQQICTGSFYQSSSLLYPLVQGDFSLQSQGRLRLNVCVYIYINLHLYFILWFKATFHQSQGRLRLYIYIYKGNFSGGQCPLIYSIKQCPSQKLLFQKKYKKKGTYSKVFNHCQYGIFLLLS